MWLSRRTVFKFCNKFELDAIILGCDLSGDCPVDDIINFVLKEAFKVTKMAEKLEKARSPYDFDSDNYSLKVPEDDREITENWTNIELPFCMDEIFGLPDIPDKLIFDNSADKLKKKKELADGSDQSSSNDLSRIFVDNLNSISDVAVQQLSESCSVIVNKITTIATSVRTVNNDFESGSSEKDDIRDQLESRASETDNSDPEQPPVKSESGDCDTVDDCESVSSEKDDIRDLPQRDGNRFESEASKIDNSDPEEPLQQQVKSESDDWEVDEEMRKRYNLKSYTIPLFRNVNEELLKTIELENSEPAPKMSGRRSAGTRTCLVCKRWFPTRIALLRHGASNECTTLSCNQCRKVYSCRKKLMRHRCMFCD